MSRPPLSILIPLSIASALSLGACDKPAKKRGAAGAKEAAGGAKRSKLPPETQFSEARLKIGSGDFDGAAEILRSLDLPGRAPAALQDWITLWLGMTELLAGREEASRPVFAALAERTASESGKLAAFLNDLGTRLSGEEPISSTITSNYTRSNYEAIAYYLYALKNEQLGAFNEALTFYRQFTTTRAEGAEPWLGFYAQMQKLRLDALNFCEYEEAVETATRARKSQDAQAFANQALEAAKVVRKRINKQSKLLASLDETLGVKSKMTEEEGAADAEAMPAAKEKWAALIAQGDFAGARQVILDPRLKSQNAIKEQDRLAARTGYLEQFKFYLVLEVTAGGYPGPIKLKDGTTNASGVARLDDTQFEFKDGKKAAWAGTDPESIYEMAKSMISPTEEPDKAAFRKWHLGNYALLIGKKDEARALMEEAAKITASYAPEIEGLLQ